MKKSKFLSGIFALLASFSVQGQSFLGTNSPGQGSNFSFTIGAGASNLSLSISNTATAYSSLYLKKGSAPTTNNYQFGSRLIGLTNQINLEAPEFSPATYNLLVYTPADSTAQSFQVTLTTNQSDLRSAAYPAAKPVVFSTTGVLANSGSGAWHYFQVDVPATLATGWRVVLSTNGLNSGNPDLYIRRGALPTTEAYDKASIGQSIDTLIFTSAETTSDTYFIGVYLPAGAASSASYTLSAEMASVITLTWDPGATDAGTQVFSNLSATGGDYYFAVTTLGTANGAWRTALNVQSGEADVYSQLGSLPSTGGYGYGSARVGSDGYVLAEGSQFTAGQTWYLLVHATPGSHWNLVTGEAYVQQLPQLAADASSGATVTMGAEGLHFFKTTITTNTLAWRLGLNGLGNQMYVKTTSAPLPYNTATYDLTQPGQMLVVPSYLTAGSQYFVSVVGNPGLNFTLDSRQQPVTAIPFSFTNSVSVTTYGYSTFKIQVPVQQIAWQLNVTPVSGNANVAVRQNNVPNEFVNDAFSEPPPGVGASATLVPPTLSDGAFFVTVYGTGPYTVSLFNGQPIITPVDYIFSISNDAPSRVGWRYYTVVNTGEQLGTLGWELDLTNQVPGTEIAIRRNAVPGQWSYRNNALDYTGYSDQAYVDFSSALGFLQQPNHPADVWYIGVYTPVSALGNFVLTGSQLNGPPLAFDGAGNVTNITSQPAGKFQYFSINVPGNALGWDLRLTNATTENPYLYVCRDQLPSPANGNSWYPYYSATWPSGYQWVAGSDWTGYAFDSDEVYRYGQVLEMGMGNPLQPGTYYVGVVNSTGTDPFSYGLLSRGIGLNMALPVVSLPFSNGVATNLALNGREAAYYAVNVPSNQPSWRVELRTNSGESLLMVQKDFLPNVDAGGSPSTALSGGRKMQKTGNEQYALLPASGQSNLLAGTYYLAVASEGVNPGDSVLGAGASAYTLSTCGSMGVSNIGIVDKTGLSDILATNAAEAGQISAFQFAVPDGTLALEVFLENPAGNPVMTLLTGSQWPSGSDGYGVDGGQGYSWSSATLINIANPLATNYSLLVQAVASGGDASYRIRIHALVPAPVVFDGGFSNVINQAAGTWQYFSFTVPSNALGWDIRLTNATVGNPCLYVCKDQLPQQSSPYVWYPYYSTTWPSDFQWQAGADWTGYAFDNDGTYRYGQILEMGMGNPLAPGTYFVGVINSSGTNAFSYTLLSRGIGSNMAIPVMSLPFSDGVATNLALDGREAAYYCVTVPPNQPSWRMELATNSGDALLMVQQNCLPNIDAGGSPSTVLDGGRKLQKIGNEQYVLLPASGETTIPGGTYYVGVVSEGVDPENSYLGTGASAYTLASYGNLTVSNIGTVDNTGVTDLLQTNSCEAGQVAVYQFTVPPATLSLEVFLENTVGSPMMTLIAGPDLPSGYEGYGLDGGQGYSWSSPALINIPNPAVTNYSLMVQAGVAGGDASYSVRIHALGPLPVTFDGGSSSVVDQAAGTWQYFVVNVPSNALGWDVRITGATSGNPSLYVCRDQSPSQSNPNFWYPYESTNWPSGFQWQAGYDWTGYPYDNNGVYRYGQTLEMGMGNPLVPGSYYVGVISTSGTDPISYTLVSRGIGSNMSIPVVSLPFSNGVVTNLSLPAGEAAYYSVVIPSNVPDWKMRVTDLTGESMVAVEENALPNVAAGASPATGFYGGHKMQKAGNEQYLLLPAGGETSIPAGTYYILVGSEGNNPSGPYLGSDSSSFSVTSYGSETISNLGPVGAADLLSTNALQGGENALLQFSIPPGSAGVEVRLDDITGAPYLTMSAGNQVVNPGNNYGYDGGASANWGSSSLITLPNPLATNYSLTLQASYLSGLYPDAIATVHIRQMPTPTLVFDSSLNGGGFSNVVSGALQNNQSAFYEVTVPPSVNGQPVIGWKLDLTRSTGSATVRVRQGQLPDDNYYGGSSPFVANEAIIVPDYLTPGTWFVEVRGAGSTSYTLTSSSLQTKRPAWAMPVQGNPVTTAGLPSSGPLFGDTGVDTNGVALPGDQGTDLAQGAFDYYTIVVPPGNIGVMRTRLDAISGNPNMYIRVAEPSTLSHNSAGTYGSALYDRNLSGAGGSEYGNWVPINGRYEPYLTNGVWYLAVQASGGANVRYRLRLYTGIVNTLALNGGSYTNQTLAAGDWLYYAVAIPANAQQKWNVTFGEQLGNVIMYVRDRVPPGQGANITDYKDWSADNKNHSSDYASYDPPGAYTFNTPPVRPGNTYFLGFRAVTDSSFSVSCNTNAGSVDYTNSIAFYGGALSTNVPGNSTVKLHIDVPADARRLILNFTNVAPFNIYLDQGSIPARDGSDPWSGIGVANASLNQPLYNDNGWPWLGNYTYYLYITNTSSLSQPLSFGVNGLNCATDDADNDGLPDCWELTYFPSIDSYGPNDDPDGDGVRNLDEYLEGTDPANPLSFHPRLLLSSLGGTINVNPAGNATTTPPKIWFNLGQSVQLTATPGAGYSFLGWSGDATGANNPLTVVMSGHSNISAIFGISNQPNADYQFQNNLHSSVGTPPDLTDIAAGNAFITDTVDGVTTTVYHFPASSSVELLPADSVIPSNVYTAVLLFRFDSVGGYRRIFDVKNPPADQGLYSSSGTLSFYPVISGPSASLAANTYVQVVLTHDASSNVVGYVNGAQQFSFIDTGNYGVLGGVPEMLRFFKDDGGEDSGGAVARIRLYGQVMPPAQVAALDRLPATVPPPHFLSVSLSGGVVTMPAQLAPGFPYRLQGSTDLINWIDLSTNTPAATPFTFTNILSPAYKARFYRLATP